MASAPPSFDLSPPTFDLETWASNYDGALLPLRLAHVSVHCPSLAYTSLSLAIASAKGGKDTQLYLQLREIAVELGFHDLGLLDQDWVMRQDEANKRELHRLESELRGYKNNLIRESIRMGQEDLATHHLVTGGPAPDPANPQAFGTSGYYAAYQAFGKIRDYCTTPTHIASMTLRLLYTALVQAVGALQRLTLPTLHFHALLANAGRLRTCGVKEEEQVRLTPIAFAASAIAQLGLGAYRDAALCFINTPFEYHTLGPVHGADFAKVMASGNDIAIYGGLCALATLSRQELVDIVLGGSFRQFLELEPHMRKAISLYTTAKYQACLAGLRRYYSDWSLDVFLGTPITAGSGSGSHVDRLIARIRDRSITAYFASFSEVSLTSLASTFPPQFAASDAMELEVLSMIESGSLDARLDTVNGILTAPRKDLRAATHTDAGRAAEEVERTLLLRLHKVNATLAGLEIPRSKDGRAAGPGGMGWDGMTTASGFHGT